MAKINYNFGSIKKMEGLNVGYIEGWTIQPKEGDVLTVRDVTVKGEAKKVANVVLSTTLSKSMMKYAFGEDFSKEQHFIECSAWGTVAERLEKFQPTAGMILGVFGTLKVNEFTRKDGTKGSKIVMVIENFKPVTKKKISGDSAPTSDNEVVEEDYETGDIPF